MSDVAEEHRHAAGQRVAGCAVLTVSDTRTADTDAGGKLLREALAGAGHRLLAHDLVRDEPDLVRTRLETWLADPGIQLVLTTGGTGIAPRDTTIEVVEALLDKRLDGFGELFRMLSYEQVGSAAMLSRATAGLAGETFVFALPGSTKALRLALDRLILPEIPHLLWQRGG
ncbi:MAG: MogA/MoaB family molybdenum cofactor biosynthesis protein [Acidobacteria bacterium]|nr:MogA/MoaB family molybdenum cofactor biosynthesis protein [Acidobacteriota bacterium]